MSHNNWMRGRTLVYTPAPKVSQPPSTCSHVFSRIGCILVSALRKTCIVIGAFFLILAVLGIWAASKNERQVPTMPDHIVLSMNLDGTYPEAASSDDYMALLTGSSGGITIDDVIDALHKATNDKRVDALVVHSSGGSYDITQIQQIRAAIMAFRASGKKAYIYGESYGEGGHGLGLYYFASAFDEIWMQPVGAVTLGGINLEAPFFKDLMDKYGVQAQFFHRKEYKNAMEHLTADHMSDPSREMTTGLVNELASQLIVPIKASRAKVSKNFDELLDMGLIADTHAIELGLIDKLDYEDKLLDGLQKKYKDSQLIAMDDYWEGQRKSNLEARLMHSSKAPTVAIIHVNGIIVSGSPSSSPYGMEESMSGADDIAAAIHQAGDDKNVSAIILRVNSPGGSPSASETIHRAVRWATVEKKKPVYVSMGAMAASGGYWISAGATKIYALDATLTGSIGVVGGKVNLQNLWQKFDIHWDGVKYGKNAGLMSFNSPFSPSEQKQFEETLDSVYAAFIDHVVQGRHMDAAKAESVAKGHVWTGREAVKLGLVDEIGGQDKVLDDIAKQQGLSGRDKLQVKHLPEAQGPLGMLVQMMSSQSSMPNMLKGLNAVSAEFQGARAYVLDTSLLTAHP